MKPDQPIEFVVRFIGRDNKTAIGHVHALFEDVPAVACRRLRARKIIAIYPLDTYWRFMWTDWERDQRASQPTSTTALDGS